MVRRTQIPLMLLAAAILLPATVHAQVPESARVPITDPELLESLGYPVTARNVFLRTVAPGTGEEWRRRGDGLQPTEFGSSNWNTTVSGYEFQPSRSGLDYEKGPGAINPLNGSLFVQTGGGTFEAQLDMPQGADWNWLDVFGYQDNTSQNLVVTAIERCLDYFQADNPIETVLATSTISDQDGYFWVGPAIDTTVNNSTCTYHVRARFGSPGSVPSNIALTKTRAEWARQVSPAPATARFSDVPTSHPQFRFVEALAASGVTCGCGSGKFCPNAPLTRGQMAVFLSAALGLHWAN